MKTYMVTWTFDGKRRLIDVDSETLVATIAIALSEVGRTEISISGHDYEIDSETAARIKAVILSRINSEGVREALEVMSG